MWYNNANLMPFGHRQPVVGEGELIDESSCNEKSSCCGADCRAGALCTCAGEEAVGILLQVLRTQGDVCCEPDFVHVHSPSEWPAQRPACSLRRKRKGEIHLQVLRDTVHQHRLSHSLKVHPPPQWPPQRQPRARVVKPRKMKDQIQPG